MELIDKQQAFVTLTEYYKHRTLIEHLMLSEALDRVPTVKAVPIEFIQKRINHLHDLAEYDFEANGGYIGQAHVAEFELQELIDDWKKEQEKQNEQKNS